MTRERRLAIEMWEDILAHIKAHDEDDEGEESITALKREFCREHNLHWDCYCWFCCYLKGNCWKCPISAKDPEERYGGCSWSDSPYHQAGSMNYPLDWRVEGAEQIIRALRGEK